MPGERPAVKRARVVVPTQWLAGVALEFGFSSQILFTRLFSGLTGMTPTKYREQFRQTLG